MSKNPNNAAGEEMNVLQISLHGELVGYLAGYQNGRNALSFANAFKSNPER